MTAGMIVGLVLLPFAWILIAGANKAHRDETGVNAPTRDAMRRIRRNARKKGISEVEAYNQWLNRKTSKLRHGSTVHHGHYVGDTQPEKPGQSAEDLARDKADEPLKARAKAQRISVHRQFNGLYYLLDHGNRDGVTIKNPLRPNETNFARKEVEAYLTMGMDVLPVKLAMAPTDVAAGWLATPDDELIELAAARNWTLHRQTNGRYYILNLNCSPTKFVTNPDSPAKHEFTHDEIYGILKE